MKRLFLMSSLLAILSGCQTSPKQIEEPALVLSDEEICAYHRAKIPIPVEVESLPLLCNEEAIINLMIDKKERQLRNLIDSKNFEIVRFGKNINITISGDAAFSMGSTELSSEIKPALITIAEVLSKKDDIIVIVAGHTDSIGDSKENLRLSTIRAQKVATYMHASGLRYGRSKAIGYGEKKPACSNSSPEGWECNRRIELIILPLY